MACSRHRGQLVTVAIATQISLEAACGGVECADFAFPLHRQLSKGYEVCSVLPLSGTVAEWRAAHRTARKRADRCARLGYHFQPVVRRYFADDIYEINTSLPERQGRPMSRGYHERPSTTPDPLYTCPRHAVRTYGILRDSRLVAYLWLYRAGELALVSSILGHGQHLANDVMYLLVEGVIKRELPHGGMLVYNRHDSGTDGLRYFKEKLGFEPVEVEWAL